MNRIAVIGELRSVWDTLSYLDKLQYIYGYIGSHELTEDFLANMDHVETEDLALDLNYLIELSNKNRGING
jgi:hypothetical protein